MIYVFDNAASYSAHTVYFVEADDNLPEDVVLEILRGPYAYGYEDPDGFIVCRAREIEWREGGAQPLAGFLRASMLIWEDGAEAFQWHPVAERVPASLVRETFQEWAKTIFNYSVEGRKHEVLKLMQIAKRYGIPWEAP